MAFPASNLPGIINNFIDCPCAKCTSMDEITGELIHRKQDKKNSKQHVRDFGLYSSQQRESFHDSNEGIYSDVDNAESFINEDYYVRS